MNDNRLLVSNGPRSVKIPQKVRFCFRKMRTSSSRWTQFSYPIVKTVARGQRPWCQLTSKSPHIRFTTPFFSLQSQGSHQNQWVPWIWTMDKLISCVISSTYRWPLQAVELPCNRNNACDKCRASAIIKYLGQISFLLYSSHEWPGWIAQNAQYGLSLLASQ